MAVKALYTAEATASGGRQGGVRSSDGAVDLTLVSPPELGGDGGDGTNPEQLFAAGYAGCFHSALLIVAERKELDASGSTVTARVGLGPGDEGPGWGLAVTLRVALPNLDRERAERLAQSAHKVCPYSNAIRGNVDVEIEVEAGAEATAAN